MMVAEEPRCSVVVDEQPIGTAHERGDQRAGQDLFDHDLQALRPAAARTQGCSGPVVGPHLTSDLAVAW